MVNERHVLALRELGLNAKLMYFPAKAKVERFETTAPLVLADEGIHTRDDDIFVVPESWAALHKLIANLNVKKILHCQNAHYIFHGFENLEYIQIYGYQNIMVCSQYVKNFFIQNKNNCIIDVVRPSIGEAFVRNGKDKKMQIAYMPRKRNTEAIYLQGLFKSKYPKYKDIPWVAIENVSQYECAEILNESMIFASLSFMEGLGLPPLEAMKCECVCVGFTGLAGIEYANELNGYWVAEGDYDCFVQMLATALDDVANSDKTRARLISYADTLKMFEHDYFKIDLLKFWKKILHNKIDQYMIRL